MKICPTCRKTYADDGLNFCLEDGSVLTLAAPEAPETVVMTPPRSTESNPPFLTDSVGPGTWSNTPKYSMQPQKSSKTWVWLALIFLGLILICGGGVGGVLLYLASISDANHNDRRPTPTPVPTRTPPPSRSPTPSPTSTNDARTNIQTIDLKAWVRDNAQFGNTEFTDGEFIMSSKEKGYYYVLASPPGYLTEGADTKVTVRNIDDDETTLGYGLIFHSNPKPLQKDYALLIDAKQGRYRVVRHVPGNEINVVAWTNSSAVETGTAENVLEARDKAGKVDLYINGQLVTTIPNTYGYKGGVPGLYSGDAVRAAFKDLVLAR